MHYLLVMIRFLMPSNVIKIDQFIPDLFVPKHTSKAIFLIEIFEFFQQRFWGVHQ